MEPRLAFALLASVGIHLCFIALPYVTQDNARSHDTERPHRDAVMNVTLSNKARHTEYALKAERPIADMENIPHSAAARHDGGIHSVEAAPIPSVQLPLTAYYAIEQVTKRPQPITVAQLDPPEVSPLLASGKIIMKLWINEWGGVNDVDVEKSDLPAKFSEAAIAAMKKMKFTPGEFYGRRVAVVTKIEIRYDDFRAPPP